MLHSISAALLALGVGAFGFAAASLGERFKALVGIISAAIFAFSPFALGLISDPLGAGLAVTMLLFLAMLFDVLRILRNMPLPVQCVLTLLAIVHDGALLLPVAVYVTIVGRRGGKWSLGFLLVAGMSALFARSAMFGQWDVYPRGQLSTSLSAIATAFLLFALLPIALFVTKRRFYERAGLAIRDALPGIALAAAMVLSGVFSYVGDPSAYWLSGEAAFILATLSVVRWENTTARRYAAIFGGVVFFAAIAVHAAIRPALASQVASNEATFLHSALLQGPRVSAKNVCVTGADLELYHPLFGDAFSRVYGLERFAIADTESDCIERLPLPNQIVVLENAQIRIVDEHAMALAGALRQRELGAGVRIASGVVTPKSSIAVRGHGAFADTIDTERGSAPALTVIAGFTYTVPCSLQRPSKLTFAAANPLAAAPRVDPVRFEIRMLSNEGQTLLAARTLNPALHVKTPPWAYYEAPIPAHRRCSALQFRATAPTGHAMGTWVTFVAPTLR
jgi:hypothetical protein